MASIPLPALAVNTQQASPLEQYGKVLSLQSLMNQQKTQGLQQTALTQENQQRALMLQDQQTLRTLSAKHVQKDDQGNVTGFDFDGLIKDAGAAGVSPQTLNMMQNQRSEMIKNYAAADDATRNNAIAKNKALYEGLESLRGIQDPGQRQAALPGLLKTLQQQGVDVSKIPPNAPLDDNSLNNFEAGLGMHAQVLADAKTAAETAANQAKVTEANTNAQKFQAELPGGPLNRVTQDVQVATNPEIQKGKVAVAAAEGAARANVEAAMARGSNAALANVPPHLITPATEAATKAGTEYAAAKSVSDRMNATMNAARKGNVVSYQIIPQEGTLQITTSQGVHRINKTEIDQYAGGGSLWQRMEGDFGKALSGKSIPASVLDDMAEIQKIQAEGARSKYENSLRTINQNFGSAFKPVEMDAPKSDSLAKPSLQVGQTVTLKNGKTVKVTAVHPDGSFDAQ